MERTHTTIERGTPRAPPLESPRDLAQRAEVSPTLPEGTEERFSGYGVVGLPFRSGHVLALRRFAASSMFVIGQAFFEPFDRTRHRAEVNAGA